MKATIMPADQAYTIARNVGQEFKKKNYEETREILASALAGFIETAANQGSFSVTLTESNIRDLLSGQEAPALYCTRPFTFTHVSWKTLFEDIVENFLEPAGYKVKRTDVHNFYDISSTLTISYRVFWDGIVSQQ